MSKRFLQTAYNYFLNVDFIKSFYYKVYDKGNLPYYELIADCIEGAVCIGFVSDERVAIEILNDICEGFTPKYLYFTEESMIKDLREITANSLRKNMEIKDFEDKKGDR